MHAIDLLGGAPRFVDTCRQIYATYLLSKARVVKASIELNSGSKTYSGGIRVEGEVCPGHVHEEDTHHG